jgi:hypothetical protein
MNEQLISTLTDLAVRKYASEEGNELLSSFLKKTITLRASFVSNERTFSSRYEKSYVDGQTILALLGEKEHEVAILIHPDSNWKEDHKPVLPLKHGDTFEIEVELLGFNALHQRATFGEFIPEKMSSHQNEGGYGSRPDVTVKTPSVQPPRERPKRKRRTKENQELETKNTKRSVQEEDKSKNLGCNAFPLGLPEGNYLKWLIFFLSLSLIAFVVGYAIRQIANIFN